MNLDEENVQADVDNAEEGNGEEDHPKSDVSSSSHAGSESDVGLGFDDEEDYAAPTEHHVFDDDTGVDSQSTPAQGAGSSARWNQFQPQPYAHGGDDEVDFGERME